MIFFLLLILILAIPFLVRWLCWLAIVQQKEYRWDRLSAYLATRVGLAELFSHLIPRSYELTRTGLKRPKFSLRVIATALLSLGLITASMVWAWLRTDSYFVFSLVSILVHFLSPVFIMLAAFLLELAKQFVINQQEFQAQAKIDRSSPQIIAITGSYGKTATKLVMAHCLSQKFSVFSPPKSHNNRYSLARAINTSYSGQELAVLEYAAYKKGEIKRLCQAYQPDMAVITGLTDQHLAIFGSQANIIKAKSELPQSLRLNQPVFINGFDPGTLKIAQAAQSQEIIDFSGPESKIKITQVGLNKAGQLKFRWRSQLVQTELVGQHYLATCLAAMAVADYLGLNQQQIIQGLATFEPPEYMIQIKSGQLGQTIIDDGRTSNPQGFKAALLLTKQMDQLNSKFDHKVLITSGIVDLGCKSTLIHKDLAKISSQIFDQVIYLGEPGKVQFEQVFKQDLVSDKAEIVRLFEKLDQKSLCLIEGRIPLWVRRALFN